MPANAASAHIKLCKVLVMLGCRAIPSSCQIPGHGSRQASLQKGAGGTSVRSSMLLGLMSRMLKDWEGTLRCQRLMRRSSADRKVSWSLDKLTLFMWYVCALL